MEYPGHTYLLIESTDSMIILYLRYYFYHRLCEKFSSVCIVEVIVLAVVNLEINFDSNTDYYCLLR